MKDEEIREAFEDALREYDPEDMLEEYFFTAGYKAGMKSEGWISVEDRLPEDEKLKVCRVKDSYYNKHHSIVLSHYYRPSNIPNKKMWSFEFGMTQQLKITHWMPLPEPPKEQEK